MSKAHLDLLTQVVRCSPRHTAAGDVDVVVSVDRPEPLSAIKSGVSIVDLSRSGCQLLTPQSLTKGESIRLQIAPGTPDFVQFNATIRWSVKADGSEPGAAGWASGCQFDQELAYEQLGELFLLGVLSTTSPETDE